VHQSCVRTDLTAIDIRLTDFLGIDSTDNCERPMTVEDFDEDVAKENFTAFTRIQQCGLERPVILSECGLELSDAIGSSPLCYQVEKELNVGIGSLRCSASTEMSSLGVRDKLFCRGRGKAA